MNGSVIASILYVTGFAALFAAIFLLEKSEKKLNGIMWLISSLLAEMCWGGFVAAVINLVHIPINIYSMGVVYLLSAGLLGIKIWREKKIQHYQWELLDILFSAGVILIVALMVFQRTGLELDPMFLNSDAAVHLKNAVSLVQSQHLPVMYFAPFQTAMVLEIFMPAVPIYNFYKIFILLDAFLFIVELIFFYTFCREYFSNWKMKITGVLMCVLYGAGYPLLSYLLTFYYWALGVMIMTWIALLLRMYRREEVKRNYLLVLLMLACNGVTMCYMLIGPTTYIAAFLCLAVIVKSEGKLVTKSNILLALKVFLIPTILAVYYCYFEFLKKQGMSAKEVIAIDGGIYRELYVNFLLVLPFVVYWILQSVRQKKADENMIFFLTILVFVMALFFLAVKGFVSGYYFYKFYYPFWFFAYVLAIQGMGKLLEEHWEMLASYGLVFLFLFVIHFGKVEAKAVQNWANFQEEEHAGVFFHLYDFNNDYAHQERCAVPPKYMELCRYVVDELDSDKDIPLLATQGNYEDCYWYEAITGEDSSDFYGWWHNFSDVKRKLESQKVEYFAVYKNSDIFRENREYFKKYEKVYQNKKAVVYRTSPSE